MNFLSILGWWHDLEPKGIKQFLEAARRNRSCACVPDAEKNVYAINSASSADRSDEERTYLLPENRLWVKNVGPSPCPVLCFSILAIFFPITSTT